MGIFKKNQTLAEYAEGQRYRIRITTEDGQEVFWHKRGRVHLIEEDVARAFVENFKPQVFEVRPDGSLTPPVPGETKRIVKLTMEPVSP